MGGVGAAKLSFGAGLGATAGIAAGRTIGKFVGCMVIAVAIVAIVIGFGSIAALIAVMKPTFTSSRPAAKAATSAASTTREKLLADLRRQRAEAAEEARAFGREENSQFATRPSTPPLADGGVYRVGGGVSAPSVIYKVDPNYTEEARQARLSGTVVVSLIVGADGRPRNIAIVRGLGLGLDERAADAVAQWRFRPGTMDGSAVSTQATIAVNFKLF
jgi:TonB family protein